MAALSVSWSRLPWRHEIVPLVLEAAARISEMLGAAPGDLPAERNGEFDPSFVT
jgi:hypothetical protein